MILIYHMYICSRVCTTLKGLSLKIKRSITHYNAFFLNVDKKNKACKLAQKGIFKLRCTTKDVIMVKF
jgi:hypothetical protein